MASPRNNDSLVYPDTGVLESVAMTSLPDLNEALATGGSGRLPGMLSNEVTEIVLLAVMDVSLPLLQLFGIATNIINLVVFSSMGLNDCVNSSFFILSLTDLLYLLLSAIGFISPKIFHDDFQHRINFFDFTNIVIWYAVAAASISNLLTTYIAIQRCCCVALPLRFKGIFTTRRNVIMIFLIYIGGVAFYLPILSKIGLRPHWDDVTNTSMTRMWRAHDYASVLAFKDAVAGLGLPLTTQIITVVCMFILLASLRKSSSFRKMATAGEDGSGNEVKVKSNERELRVIKVVSAVTFISIVSNAVPIGQALVRRAVVEFAARGRYSNSFFVVVGVKHAVQHLNALLNIFVYLNFNTLYRNNFKNIFYRCQKPASKAIP